MKHSLYLIIVIFLASGCMLGPDFHKPVYEGSDSFRFDTTSRAQNLNLEWWNIFEDELLDTLIRQGLSNNKEVLVAATRIEAARLNIGYTKADQWPAFRYGINASISGVDNSTQSSLMVYPQMSWEIGFWGKYRRMNETAQANYLATEHAKQTVQLGLISAIASTYYTILASYDQLSIASNTLVSRDSGLIIMQDKYLGGLISLMDYNQAKIQRDIAATIVPTYKRIIAINENTLSILLGDMPRGIEIGSRFHEHEYMLDIPPGIPSELLIRRPDINYQEAIYKAKSAQIGVAEAMRWPSLNLTGLFGAVSGDLSSLTSFGLGWSVGADLVGPIFQFGKNKKRVLIAEQEAQSALLEYEQTVLNAFREVEDALVQVSTFKEELAAQESRTLTAIESEELSHVRYEEGSTTYLEVLEQQRQSFSAQLDLLANRLNLINSYILLYKSLGGGWFLPEHQDAYIKEQSNATNN